MPGPVLGHFGQGRDEFWLEEWIAQAMLQVLSGEAPGEWLAESGVALTEGDDTFNQFVEGGAVIGSEYFALDDREVDFDLVEPTRIHGGVHHGNVRVALA